jgi:methionyl-tRNA synthetase
MPQTATKIISFFELPYGDTFDWKNTGKAEKLDTGQKIKSEVLFTKLEDDLISSLRERFSGSQKERKQESGVFRESKPAFENTLDLRVAKIEKVEQHPNAEKLYIVTLETSEGVSGTREERIIVSGLVQFYTKEQLLGKHIIVAYNLKPAKLRGVESMGMLLAAGDMGGTGPDGTPVERCEVLDAGDTPTGTRLLPEGIKLPDVLVNPVPAEIDINTFLSYPITVKDFNVQSGGKNLCLNGKNVRTGIISEGKVN